MFYVMTEALRLQVIYLLVSPTTHMLLSSWQHGTHTFFSVMIDGTTATLITTDEVITTGCAAATGDRGCSSTAIRDEKIVVSTTEIVVEVSGEGVSSYVEFSEVQKPYLPRNSPFQVVCIYYKNDMREIA